MKNVFYLATVSILSVFACQPKEQAATETKLSTFDSLTQANKQLVIDHFTTAFIKKDIKAGFENFIGEKYIQHNPSVPDGKEAPIIALSNFFNANPQISTEIKRVVAEKDLVVVHSHFKLSPEQRGEAVVDIYRVENGKIVEHWDVTQEVPEKSANENTVF